MEVHPSRLFEQQIELEVDGVTITVGEGTADVKIAVSRYDADPDLHGRLHEHLFRAFRGAQLIALRPFKLESPSKTRYYPDGRRDLFLEVASAF